MLLRSHPSVKSVLNLSFLLFQPQILMSSSTIMTSSGPASSLFNYSSISSSPEASIHTASSIVTQEVYFKENAARAPTDHFQSGLELLESAHAGILNERTSYLIRSLSEGITDERLKHFLFGTAMRNLSKVASQDKVDRIYLPVSKYRILPRTISNIIDSDAVTWSDGYIAALNSNKPSPQVKLEQSLTSCLEQVVESSAATPKWFESVDDARGRLTRLLRSSLRLDSIELFGSTRSGLSCMTSDADMTCLLDKQGLHSVAQIDLSEYDREYIRQRTEIDRLNRKIAAIFQFSKIFLYIKSVEEEKSASYLESLSSFQDSLGGEVEILRSNIRQLEASLRSIQMDRHKQSILRMIGNKSAPSAASAKKVVYRIGDILRKNGYMDVHVIPFARVPVVKCRDGVQDLDIDLVINKRIAIHNSDLIKHYINADESGKVKKVAHLVKALAKAHNIGDASFGFISSYSWVVLLLHTLLLHEYLPAFQAGGALNSKEESADIFCESFYVGFSVPIPLPPYYRDRLASTSVEELLTLFTGYLSSRVNVLEDCLTMRGKGEVHKKSFWNNDCIVGKSQPGSLSVEDPFERADSICGHDLGRSIHSQRNCEIIIAKLAVINSRLTQAILSPRAINTKISAGGHRFSNDWYGLFDEKSVTSEIHRTHRQAHHSVDSKDFQKSDKSKVIDESGINDTAESDEENGKKITHILKKKKRKPRKKFDKAGKVENIDNPGNLAVSARQPGIEGNIRRDIREKITGAIAAVSGQDKKGSIAAVSGQDKKGSIAAVSGKGSIAAVSDEDKKGSIAAVSGQDKKGSIAAVSGQDKKGSIAAVSGQDKKGSIAAVSDEDKKGSIAALKSIMINRELAGGQIVDN